MAINKSESGKGESGKGGTSARAGRVKAGIVVTASIVLAAALVVLLNYLVQYVGGQQAGRWDLQTQKRYTVSDRTKRIVSQIDQPVRLTVMYTSTDKQRLGAEYGPQVSDLCRELSRLNPKIAAADVRDDKDKRELVERLAAKARGSAGEHDKLLNQFEQFAAKASQELGVETSRWQALRQAKLLDQFELPAALSQLLGEAKASLDQTAAEVKHARRPGQVPDYAKLVDEVSKTTAGLAQKLKTADSHLADIARLVNFASANDGQALKEAQSGAEKIGAAADELVKLIQEPISEDLAQAGPTLQKYVKAAEPLLEGMSAQGQMIQAFAKANPILQAYSPFYKTMPTGGMDAPLDTVYNQILSAIVMPIGQARQVLEQGAPYQQKTLLDNARRYFIQWVPQAKAVAGDWVNVLKALHDADADSKAVLAEADRTGTAKLAADAQSIADQAAKLPALEGNDMSAQIAQDNVVLVETEKSASVLDFNAVWPTAQVQLSEEEEAPRRAFNGDQAIGGKLLELTREKPLAQVVLTYYMFEPPQDTPAMLRQQVTEVFGDIPPWTLDELRRHLKEARLDVVEWNLGAKADPFQMDKPEEIPPPPEALPGVPRMLLVLPPPPPGSMVNLTQGHMDKVAEVIDAGTPALFLTGFSERLPGISAEGDLGPFYTYLRDKWGIDARPRDRVMQGLVRPSEPGKFGLALDAMYFLPLSDFTDHPVGKPLRARQHHWFNVCPVVQAKTVPDNVRIEPILEVGPGKRDVWAAASAVDVLRKFSTARDVSISPDPAAGDLLPPFSVALAAEKKVDSKSNRVVVAGIGRTYYSFYLQSPVQRLMPSGELASEPPPAGTVELAVNACYWLTGQESYIGAGASDVSPIGYISPARMSQLRIALMGLLPVLALLVGLAVLMIRRR